MTEIIQGSDAWFAMRLGKVTASRVADVIAKTKTGYGAGRANYMAQLVCERLTGTAAESFSNDAMKHGTATEPFARAAYESHADVLVDQVAFIDHPSILMSGASPDGLIGDEGMLEIKCPNTATMLDILLTETIPTKYLTQMSWQMACTDREWCDFVCYDNRLPSGLDLFVKRYYRDDVYIKTLESEVSQFIQELNEKVNLLTKLKDQNDKTL